MVKLKLNPISLRIILIFLKAIQLQKKLARAKMFKEWKSEYNVAVKQFNDDHKKLFDYFNDLNRGLLSGMRITEMSYVLEGLIDYTKTHFENEEKMMRKYNYPKYEEHKKEHDALVKDVMDFYQDFQAGKKAFTIELLKFLDDWVTNHILETDMHYKPFFTKIAKEQQSANQN